jgi:hypothetical protein
MDNDETSHGGLLAPVNEIVLGPIRSYLQYHNILRNEQEGGDDVSAGVDGEDAMKGYKSLLVNRALAMGKALSEAFEPGSPVEKAIAQILDDSSASPAAVNIAHTLQNLLSINRRMHDHIENYIQTGHLHHWISFLVIVLLIAGAANSPANVKWMMGSLQLLDWYDQYCPEYLQNTAVIAQILDDYYNEVINSGTKGEISADTAFRYFEAILQRTSATSPMFRVLQAYLDPQFHLESMRKGTLGRTNPTSSKSVMTPTERAKLNRNVQALQVTLLEMLSLGTKGKLIFPPHVDILEVGKYMVPRLHLKTASIRLDRVAP